MKRKDKAAKRPKTIRRKKAAKTQPDVATQALGAVKGILDVLGSLNTHLEHIATQADKMMAAAEAILDEMNAETTITTEVRAGAVASAAAPAPAADAPPLTDADRPEGEADVD